MRRMILHDGSFPPVWIGHAYASQVTACSGQTKLVLFALARPPQKGGGGIKGMKTLMLHT